MIQANELRIGNILQYRDESEVKPERRGKLFRITADDILFLSENKDFDLVLPVKLNEEVMSNLCGFKLRGNDMPCSSDPQNLYWTHSGFPFQIYNLNWMLMQVNTVNIKYLHRLQNLFFFVAGKEFKINL